MTNQITFTPQVVGVSALRAHLNYANNEIAFIDDNDLSSLCEHSSAISFWNYNLKDKSLTVRYLSSEQFYGYENVPFVAIFSLLSADSLGAFIAKEIKPYYSVTQKMV